jgi:peptidoglycan L-alanyl-D-glutamate endopeptidase CwlK
MNFQNDILAVQTELNARGHFRVNVDGIAGPQTWGGIAYELGLGIDTVRATNLRDVIATAQRALTRAHLYSGPADSIAGALTWAAVRRALDAKVSPPSLPQPPVEQPFEAQVDARSEAMIATLHKHTQPLVIAALLAANKGVASNGLHWVITSGTRTYAQQHQLWLKGRGLPGPIVTNAPAGYSNHNFGIACDATLFSRREPVWESPLYRRVWGPAVKAAGLEWGGDWKALKDEPHAEHRPAWARGMSTGAMLKELRSRVASGTDIFA